MLLIYSIDMVQQYILEQIWKQEIMKKFTKWTLMMGGHHHCLRRHSGSILFHQTRFVNYKWKINVSHGPEITHGFIGYKSSTKQLEWKMDSIMEVRTNLLTPPVIFENSVIFGGDWSIYSGHSKLRLWNWRTIQDLMKVSNFNRTGFAITWR